MENLTLLIDTVTITNPGGLRLQKELTLSALRQLPSGYKIVLLQNSEHHTLKGNENILVENIPTIKHGVFGRWLWYNIILPQKIKEHKADVFLSLSGILTRKICERCATIITINNMVPFTEEQILHSPFFSKARLRFLVLRYFFIKSAKMASALILHSQHALNQIMNYVSKVEEKTSVVLTGVPDEMNLGNIPIPPHPNKNIPFLFYFSAVYWYKNQINLIEGYRRALKTEENLPMLLIAGHPVDKKYVIDMKKKIVEHRLFSKIKYLGPLPSELLPAYIHHADINLFPSTCETNSIVQSEILGMHGVMACSDIPPMTEIAGDAAEFFDPYSPDSIAECIIKIHKDKSLQNNLRKKSKKRADELSWDSCGKVIWDSTHIALNNYITQKDS